MQNMKYSNRLHVLEKQKECYSRLMQAFQNLQLKLSDSVLVGLAAQVIV